MTIDQIREGIAISMDMQCQEIWFGILDHTTPGHYGVEDIEFQIAIASIWVDVPKKTFTFRDGTLSFSARLGSSREEDGMDGNFSKTVSGSGKFEFGDAHDIRVTEFSINESLDLFADK